MQLNIWNNMDISTINEMEVKHNTIYSKIQKSVNNFDKASVLLCIRIQFYEALIGLPYC